MTTYYLASLSAFGLSLVLTAVFSRWATRRRIFIAPIRERDVHTRPIPRIGGAAIVASFLLVVAAVQLLWPELLSLSNEKIIGIDRNLLGLLLGVVILGVVNLADDFKDLPWGVKLAFQIAAALLVAAFGIKIQWFTNPFGTPFFLGSLDWLFVVIWLVGLSNIINWLDGINGLAGGVSAIALATLFFLSVSPEVAQSENALIAAIGFGAVMGFLPFNIVRAKVFLGDTGSVFLGFLIGVIAIVSGGKIATAFLALAIPFLDGIVVIITRLIHHQSPFAADKRHLHHRLLALGFKPWQIVGLFYLISLLFGLFALNSQAVGKFYLGLLALLVMGALVMIYSISDKLSTIKKDEKPRN
ncbi:MAG: undecaprenyl/decaprenyl-phosphate alpha-N-acetylglucosaminyl 1-phosphate transferase [Candidatus Berkelbacteria bacterium]|nr:MAG: undecaprenyl/decaprenyl-phosphate alpha-N-acetylglucosaminyl 1-phosphate transferase [Candidatus Berkelbacteria bacterium]QQG51620.1 MAG: undecaprenyl/decaprenyl-phosphate alpha-N-acetylglucosaminyl 1-phosphate transferase [Candidatus Berkelbacteria bacterium]